MLVTTGVTVASDPTAPNFDRSSVTARSALVALTCTTVADVPSADTAAVLLASSERTSESPGSM